MFEKKKTVHLSREEKIGSKDFSLILPVKNTETSQLWTKTDIKKEGPRGLAKNESCKTKLIHFCKRSSFFSGKLSMQSGVTLS